MECSSDGILLGKVDKVWKFSSLSVELQKKWGFWNQIALVPMVTLPVMSWVTSGKLFKSSQPQCKMGKNEDRRRHSVVVRFQCCPGLLIRTGTYLQMANSAVTWYWCSVYNA